MTHDLTLCAQWTAKKAQLVYEPNRDGAKGSMAPVDGVTGDVVTVAAPEFTLEGWTATGWNTKADGSGTAVDEGDTVTLPAGGMTLYAQWKANPAPAPQPSGHGGGASGSGSSSLSDTGSSISMVAGAVLVAGLLAAGLSLAMRRR